ncbi:MAG: hypothetical protein HRT89_13030 [Lentisphaeria bacterium]|nr:hypothetical protein [Lentisphaeria bacterium]NQZ68980.1 hypothetical protein [Lentisphaeria bacterium]
MIKYISVHKSGKNIKIVYGLPVILRFMMVAVWIYALYELCTNPDVNIPLFGKIFFFGAISIVFAHFIFAMTVIKLSPQEISCVYLPWLFFHVQKATLSDIRECQHDSKEHVHRDKHGNEHYTYSLQAILILDSKPKIILFNTSSEKVLTLAMDTINDYLKRHR